MTASLGVRLRRFAIRIAAMAAKETLHIRRDPRTLYLALGMPVVMLLIFGYGVSFDIDRLPLAVADADRTRASHELVQAFEQSKEFETTVQLPSPERADAEFRAGRALSALVIPRGYEEDLVAGRDTALQLVVDGADAVVANQVLAKADVVVRAHARRLAPTALRELAPPLQVKVWSRYNPAGKSALFLVPGLAVYLLAITAVLLTALTISGEWEKGSMEQLFASPVGRLEIVLGKLFPYLVLGFIELLLVIAFGGVAFDVPFHGSVFALLAVGLFFLIGMLGQGLFISVVAKSQLVATQAGALSALLPCILLSGVMFPIENMPRILQLLTYAVPARYFTHALRGILLKGNGLDVLWPDFVAQIAFALIVLTAATLKFQRRLA
jgi:ABC-2 type transport system permease protein